MRTIIASLLLLISFGYTYGSDLSTQKSPLYPYQSSIYVFDEFISGLNTNGTTGSLGWIVNGGVATNLASSAGRPGLFRKETSAVSGTISQLVSSGNGSVWDPSSPYRITEIIRLNSNDANTTMRIGIANSFAVNPPADGIYFEKLDADTNWFCVTRAGGVQTRSDSGIAVSTNFATFVHTRSSSGVQFALNNANVCLHTTNITAALSASGFHIINSAAANKTADIDYFSMAVSGLTR